jgi:hypothetical protein
MALMTVGLAACGEEEKATTSGLNYEILPSDRTLGNPKSKVVLIEYAAHTCPACAAFNENTFPRLKTNYIDTGKILYVFRLFPLRADDGAAEKIARCLISTSASLTCCSGITANGTSNMGCSPLKAFVPVWSSWAASRA